LDAPDWLNGWPQFGNEVLIGTGFHCVGCGRLRGITSVVYEDGYEKWAAGRPMPVWPQAEGSCTICPDEPPWPDPAPEEPLAWPKGKRRPLP
jgi:hypothetical protein